MIVGIDLGTTNSLIAIWRDGRSELIPNALGAVLTPSCVSLDDNGQVLVGLPARDRLLTAPHATAANFKRYMGTDRRLQLGGRDYRPEELSALVLKSLKADAEAYLGQPVTEAVITVPAYFNDMQRNATRIAGELAGLKVERLLNEPTAAALAYGLDHAAPEAQFLVFDLGGGTFDVSLLELFAGVMEVRATAGDNFLGGEDFSEALLAGFLQHCRGTGLDPARLTAADKAQLRIEAERVKRCLSEAESAIYAFRHGERDYTWPIDQAAFEALCQPLLERLHGPLERALRDARVQLSKLDQLVLVGGATRMGIVYRMLTRLLGRFPSREIDPDQAVALGAAVQAGLKARDAALKEVVMTDVAPYSMGMAVVDQHDGLRRSGVFLPLIERNTTVPASFVKTVYPTDEDALSVNVMIYQGESRDVDENILLGTLEVGLQQVQGGERRSKAIDVRFSYDINGLLEVEATLQANGQSCSVVIERSPGAMSREEIARSLERLGQLKLLPRTASVPHALLQRMKRLYEQSLGERRAWIGERISQFELLLRCESPRELARAVEVLTHMLDRFEGAPVL